MSLVTRAEMPDETYPYGQSGEAEEASIEQELIELQSERQRVEQSVDLSKSFMQQLPIGDELIIIMAGGRQVPVWKSDIEAYNLKVAATEQRIQVYNKRIEAYNIDIAEQEGFHEEIPRREYVYVQIESPAESGSLRRELIEVSPPREPTKLG